MAVEKIHIKHFLQLADRMPVLDVRSPGEFSRAHIPGAYNLPLFTDEERKMVGTTYKQVSRGQAIRIGLDYFGPKMRRLVEEVEQLFRQGGWRGEPSAFNGRDPHRQLLIHCWRGGMRSSAIAWLMDLYGFKVYTLAGGYKKFRHWVLEALAQPHSFRLLGGYTGSGKTELLRELKEAGEAVIDLEKLAGHKGSAFGNIGLPPQPTQEMFENLLAVELYHYGLIREGEKEGTPGIRQKTDGGLRPVSGNSEKRSQAAQKPAKLVWLEDESQRIGLINLPPSFWSQMRCSPVYFIDVPFEDRLDYIVKEYGSLDRTRMADAIARIRKRLGPLETKTSLQHLENGEIRDCFRILLKYYDKFYTRSLYKREEAETLIRFIPCRSVDSHENLGRIYPSKERTG